MKTYELDPGGREAVLDRLRTILAAGQDVAFAYVHGSFMHGGPFRDIDVAVWTMPGAPRDLDIALGARLTRRAGYPVDVRVVDRAPLGFVFHALRGHPLVVHDEPRLVELIERTARAYHDQAPLSRRATREAFAR
ncbi:MAG TPA: nucleotidyltransferase domain-containing protein [Vicinamibacterales bacterium]|nr:nucleotidyltransferase domain-containing protein [Vicinamibacterales bacterium]